MKRFIREFWVPLLAILLVCLAYLTEAAAAVTTITWINASKNVGQTDIPLTGPGSLVSTTIKWGACLPDDTPSPPLQERIVPTTVPGNSESEDITIFTPGRWCFFGYHTNLEDENSADSNTAFRVVVMIPEPPGSLTVLLSELTVYTLVKQLDRFVLLEVGMVPPGTQCDPGQQVNGLFVVPNDQVTWLGNVRPVVVVADCN